MSADDSGPEGTPGFDDPTYDDLRAQLADAAGPRALPPAVAGRLDGVLAELQAERAADSAPRPRRSRVGARLLGAAAVVLALAGGGVGLKAVLDHSAPGGSDDAAAESLTAGAVQDEAATSTAPGREGALSSLSTAVGDLPRLRAASFAADVGEYLASAEEGAAAKSPAAAAHPELANGTTGSDSADAGADASADTYGQRGDAEPTPTPADGLAAQENRALGKTAGARACTAPRPARRAGAQSIAIRLDGARATLVYRPAADGSTLAQAWSCDGSRLLATATIGG